MLCKRGAVLEKPWTSPSHCLRTEAFMRDGGVVFERGCASRESRQRPMPHFRMRRAMRRRGTLSHLGQMRSSFGLPSGGGVNSAEWLHAHGLRALRGPPVGDINHLLRRRAHAEPAPRIHGSRRPTGVKRAAASSAARRGQA